jgi:hypothetical protein
MVTASMGLRGGTRAPVAARSFVASHLWQMGRRKRSPGRARAPGAPAAAACEQEARRQPSLSAAPLMVLCCAARRRSQTQLRKARACRPVQHAHACPRTWQRAACVASHACRAAAPRGHPPRQLKLLQAALQGVQLRGDVPHDLLKLLVQRRDLRTGVLQHLLRLPPCVCVGVGGWVGTRVVKRRARAVLNLLMLAPMPPRCQPSAGPVRRNTTCAPGRSDP